MVICYKNNLRIHLFVFFSVVLFVLIPFFLLKYVTESESCFGQEFWLQIQLQESGPRGSQLFFEEIDH